MISSLIVQFIARFHRPRLILTHNSTLPFLLFNLFKKVEFDFDSYIRLNRRWNESLIWLLLHLFFYSRLYCGPGCAELQLKRNDSHYLRPRIRGRDTWLIIVVSWKWTVNRISGTVSESHDRGYTDAIVYQTKIWSVILSLNRGMHSASPSRVRYIFAHAMWRARTLRCLFITRPEPLAQPKITFSQWLFSAGNKKLMSATVKNTQQNNIVVVFMSSLRNER